MEFENLLLRSVVLLEGGALDLTKNEKLETIPEYSIVTPLLKPPAEFDKSARFELDTFLDRLETYNLPEVFGTVYDPKFGIEYLREVLEFNPSIIVVQSLPIQGTKPVEFSEKLMELRNLIPMDIALYFPGDVPIGYTNLLFASGVDIVDDSGAYISAFYHKSFRDGFIQRDRKDRNLLISENLNELQRDVRGVHSVDDLYARLNRASHTSPDVATYIRYYYRTRIDLSSINLNKQRELRFVGEESLYHPVVRAYMDRMEKTYIFPEDAELLVLVPCSAKKPYSESRSHRQFDKIIRKAYGKGRGSVVVWSLTSPLGVVPRELENIFPASNYDIPVSGDWSETESRITGEFLRRLLDKVPSGVNIVAHLSPGYRAMFELGTEGRDVENWIGKNPASYDASGEFFNNLKKFEVKNSRSIKMVERLRKIEAVTRWQFGPEFTVDLSDLKFKGYSPKPIQASKNGKHWLSWDVLNGTVKFSVDAIQSSNFKTEKRVIVEGDIGKSSTVFRPGILSVGEGISPGDEVLLFNEKEEFIGIGTMTVSARAFENMTSGAILRIRKKVRR